EASAEVGLLHDVAVAGRKRGAGRKVPPAREARNPGGRNAGRAPGMLCPSLAPRVASATAPDPRRSDEGIAVATSRSSNAGDGAVPPQPTSALRTARLMRAQGGRGPGGRHSSSPYGPVRLVVVPTPGLASPLRAGRQTWIEPPTPQTRTQSAASAPSR